MSGFRDTFSKNDEEDGLLDYDDSAFYYFAGTVLLVILIPWTWSSIKAFIPEKSSRTEAGDKRANTSLMQNLAKDEEASNRRSTNDNFNRNFTRLGMVFSLWCLFAWCMSQVGGDIQVKRFDPFDILALEYSADDKQIKKAYHRLAKEYHPDKNPDDPLAQAHFINIKKAYDCLTDENAKKNFEKYGNPDGPQATKVGIGLPAWLLSKNNQIWVLTAFFLVIIVIIPASFVSYYNRTKKYASNGILLETMQFLGHFTTESTRIKMLPELYAASAESRGLKLRPTDDADMKPVTENVIEGNKRKYNQPIIVKNQYLIWGHMQRVQNHMSQNLKDDLASLLKYAQKICQVMIQIAAMREWFYTCQAIIDFHRCLIQAADPTRYKNYQLFQIPHFGEEEAKQAARGNKANTVRQFIDSTEDTKKTMMKAMNATQQADIIDFCANYPEVSMEVKAYVEDEDEICVGDILTVEFNLTRKHLKEGEKQGNVHAPFFPKQVQEEWYIYLIEPSGSTRILGQTIKKSQERQIVDKICFQAGRPGKFTYHLHAISDSYFGIDQKVDVTFTVKTEAQVKREIYVHPEDTELDKIPTLFEQFVGAVKEDESDDEESDDEPRNKKGESSSSSGSSSSDSDCD